MSGKFYYYSSNGGSGSSASQTGHSLDETFQCMWSSAHGYGLHCNALICGRNLSVHLREAHGIYGADKDRVVCQWEFCNKELNKESLTRHLEETHMGIIHRCQCGSTFSRRDTLNKHMKTHR
ncbi:hypothetical protein BD769DRAFT_1461326 [Suillus cothurnatus]|nr:hypothetical protein BD769DRAFT_1461326 [Suillus cothurnatus]